MERTVRNKEGSAIDKGGFVCQIGEAETENWG